MLWQAIEMRFERYWRRSGRSWSDTAVHESARLSAAVCRPMMWHRRFAWPPSWRCRAIAIAAARSWLSCTASPRTRWPTRTVPSAEPGPEQAAIDADSVTRMSELLKILPDKQREILILRVVVGLSAEETAEAVGSTAGAVRVAQHRALARLKSAIAAAGRDYV